MYENLIYILVLILGFPAGLILSNMCKDEIKSWKKRLIIMSIICFIIAIIISFVPFSILKYKLPIIVTMFFVIITSFTIVWKSLSKN
jgi:hypothetical protein